MLPLVAAGAGLFAAGALMKDGQENPGSSQATPYGGYTPEQRKAAGDQAKAMLDQMHVQIDKLPISDEAKANMKAQAANQVSAKVGYNINDPNAKPELSFAQKEAQRFQTLAATDRYAGFGAQREFNALSDEFKGAGGVDLNGYNKQIGKSSSGIDNAENFVNNEMRARALGGYGGSAEQMAATAQAEDARKALASAAASRGGAFHGAGAMANATVDAQRDANRTGILGHAAGKDSRMAAYLGGMQSNAAQRQSMAGLQAQTQFGVTDRRMAALQGAANTKQMGVGARLGFNQSAQGNERLGQTGTLAEMEGAQDSARRADAMNMYNDQKPGLGDRLMQTGSMGVGLAGQYIGGKSDERVKWGRKRETSSKLDGLIAKGKG